MKEIIQDNQTGANTCNGCRNCGAGCTCGRFHGYNGHPLLRIILALVLLGFVFAAGMKLGELKAELGIGYERHAMMSRGGDYQLYNQQAMPMMPAGTAVITPATTTTSTTTAPVLH